MNSGTPKAKAQGVWFWVEAFGWLEASYTLKTAMLPKFLVCLQILFDVATVFPIQVRSDYDDEKVLRP